MYAPDENTTNKCVPFDKSVYICFNPAKTNAYVSGDTYVLVVQLFMHLLYHKTACTSADI